MSDRDTAARRRQRRPALPMDSSVFFKLVRVVNLTARPFSESIGKAHRLSLNEWRVLLVLATHPGVAASEVTALTGLDKMSVSRAIATLARQGRVLRKVDPADKRRMLLRLSTEGKRLYERIGAPAKERERRLFRGIGEQERERLERTLDRLVDNLVAADERGD
jgi:DNA-binding MarR family transcriptional regulator